MPISYTCPHCGATTDLSDEFASMSGPCARCGKTISIPPLPSAGDPGAPPSVRPKNSSAPIVLLIIAGVVVFGVCTAGILVALLLPALQSPREAARRMQCSNNMHQIAIGLMNYETTKASFPPPFISDDTGSRVHSWRSLIAPFMEARELRNYSFDEPWNGPKNVALAESEVSVFTCPSDADGDANRTNYVAVVGPGFAFDETAVVRFSSIADGARNTILLVEVAGTDIQWAEPRDLTFEEFLALYNDQAVSHHPEGCNVTYADGSVEFLHYGLAAAELRALFTRDGGEPLNFQR